MSLSIILGLLIAFLLLLLAMFMGLAIIIILVMNWLNRESNDDGEIKTKAKQFEEMKKNK